MAEIQLNLSIEQIIQLLQQIPKEMRDKILSRWEEGGNAIEIPDLPIKDFDTPLQLEGYALSDYQLSTLRELWKDSPSADELCKMLKH